MQAYTTTPEGKIVDLVINGKPVKKSYANALAKAQETSFWKMPKTEENQATNPFSGASENLSAIEKAVYDWTQAWYRRYEAGAVPGKKIPAIQTFDNMRYLFMALNQEAYMNLLD